MKYNSKNHNGLTFVNLALGAPWLRVQSQRSSGGPVVSSLPYCHNCPLYITIIFKNHHHPQDDNWEWSSRLSH